LRAIEMSYSNEVKAQLAEIKTKNTCCAAAYCCGLAGIPGGFVCAGCKKSYFRGLFISCGNIPDPKTAYHLEFVIIDEAFAKVIAAAATAANILLKYIKRRRKHVLYMKSSEQIEDFLYYIDAPKISFELMETKIIKDVRNNANRITNFENANLEKISKASAEQIGAIKFIIEKGLFDSLPDELKQTADLRLENIELSIQELGEISEPPVSKSGIKHRMQRLLDIAAGLK